MKLYRRTEKQAWGNFYGVVAHNAGLDSWSAIFSCEINSGVWTLGLSRGLVKFATNEPVSLGSRSA